MDIRIDEKLVRDVVSSAILNSLDQNQREMLISNAIAYLLTPPAASGYGHQKPVSPIQEAFNDALRRETQKFAHEILSADPTVREKIRTLIEEGMERVMTNYRDAVVDRIAKAITDGITGKDY